MNRYNVTCDYKCNLRVIQKDEGTALIAAKANEAEMMKDIKPYFSPSITVLASDADLKSFKEKNTVFALALLKVQYNHVDLILDSN
jgi:hypothetical protein